MIIVVNDVILSLLVSQLEIEFSQLGLSCVLMSTLNNKSGKSFRLVPLFSLCLCSELFDGLGEQFLGLVLMKAP